MNNPFEGPKLFSPSFVDALRAYAPELLELRAGAGAMPEVPHGTTVAAVRFADGVAMGGDRRATEGMNIAQRDIEKVFPADDFSAVAIAGAAGPAIEMVRLFQTELEHYEKIEGSPLSLEGKANKLGQMVRSNLPMAMQGLVVLPLFCGYDTRRQAGRIFRYDVTGGRWEDADYHATGSGGKDARGSLKKRFRPDMDGDAAVAVLVEAIPRQKADLGWPAAGVDEQVDRHADITSRRGFQAVQGRDEGSQYRIGQGPARSIVLGHRR